MAHILLVEDDPDVAELFAEDVADMGHDVTIVEDGEAALARVSKEAPDLILLDKHLPRMNGLDVARRLKSAPSTQSIPIILVTADIMSDRDESLAVCDDIESKPLEDLLRLADKIDRLVKRPP